MPHLRILVIDDRLDSVAVLVDRLRQLHHLVDTADNSMEAISLVGRKASAGHGYHLIITDVNMPILDGVGLVRELQRRHERVPVAFITGAYASSKMRQEAANLGLVGILSKPPTEAELAQVLSRVGPSPSERLPTAQAGQDDDVFFGTARMTHTASISRPQEGALARARVDERDQAAPVDLQALAKGPAPKTAPAPQAAPPVVAPELSGGDSPESPTSRRTRTPDPTAFYTPSGSLGSTSAFYRRPKTDPFLPASGNVDPRLTPPPPGTARDPVTGHYRRSPSGLYAADPTALPTTTSRFRRATDTNDATTRAAPEGASLTPLGQQALPDNRAITSGFRRSLTGATGGTTTTTRNPQPSPKPGTGSASTCTVACAHCQGLFQVLVKSSAYTVLCVHCGQINRIDPLPG